MMKNIFKLISFCAVCFVSFNMISCGVSTGEVVDAGNDVADEMKVVYVQPGEIPIIEICPPFEVFVPDEPIPEKVPGKPGESYDNLLPPVDETESDSGIVCVITDVPGVEVSFNNRIVGESNIGVVGITPRIYILGLSKEGYKEESLWISVGENKKQVFSITMEKE